ncbi:hypothetical protein QWY85_07900 [Neolewinella lacunae]|uniref:Tetratricopeptide repeat protein n=1 Tax=Neolewinella lacunae TaxID=1517758 RepID=A0A923PID3_9BACT|nr:hypothetical protein [Neolewinella lacunae]MBC6994703.1 hypothetical protein [Neolewinella lacunae]MDN3634575.1 hypothetical protein [Neolewinella lacunae]
MHLRHLPSFLTLICCAVFLVLACTPKAVGPVTTTETPTTTTPKPPKPADSNLSPCKKFSDAPNPDDAETNYVIYRQMLNAQDMAGAFSVWRKVYATSPAADGKRATVYTDGIAFYNNLIQKNPAKKDVYADSIIALYQEARRCYPGDGYMAAIQAFDSYYTYPGSATEDEIYALFKESIETDGPEKLQYFVINPMSSLVVKMHREGKIDAEEAKEIVSALNTRLALGLKECQGADCEAWKTIENYAPDALRYFETVAGFYDCQYYIDQYYGDYLANPTDCDAISTAYSRLRYGACGEETAEFQQVKAAFEANCRVQSSSGPSTLREAYDALEQAKYSQAIDLFEQAANETDDAERKGRYLLTAAKIYYSHQRNFGQARAYARKAAAANPNFGEPYMLIGTLYASSGPLCGPGTGFDSQVVTWPAIDMWQRAKSVDPSVAGKANALIARYSQYMPSKSDIFQRGIKEGDSFTVGCWIQETTRVRTP